MVGRGAHTMRELEEGDGLVSLCCMADCVGGWPDGRRAMVSTAVCVFVE